MVQQAARPRPNDGNETDESEDPPVCLRDFKYVRFNRALTMPNDLTLLRVVRAEFQAAYTFFDNVESEKIEDITSAV